MPYQPRTMRADAEEDAEWADEFDGRVFIQPREERAKAYPLGYDRRKNSDDVGTGLEDLLQAKAY